MTWNPCISLAGPSSRLSRTKSATVISVQRVIAWPSHLHIPAAHFASLHQQLMVINICF
jgi:hypothetical protein